MTAIESAVIATETVQTTNVTHRFEVSYATTATERAGIAVAELAAVNLDIPMVTTTVLAACAQVKEIGGEIAAALPGYDIGKVAHTETLAEALAFAQTVYLSASAPAEDLPAIVAKAATLRETLLTDASALAHRGLLDGKPLGELKGGPGYLNIGSDLGVLARMLRARWTTISSKSAIQAEELDQAEKLFEQITLAFADRNQLPARAAKAAEDRQRAFTLVLRAYDEIRRTVTYVRWRTDDGDKIAPSLWAGRGGRGSSSNVVPPPPPPPPPPVVTSHSAEAVASPAEVIAAIEVPVAGAMAGMPGSSPFAS